MTEQKLSSNSDGPAPALRLVQITDTHLFGDPGGKLLGLNTQHSFDAVLEQIDKNGPAPELLVATGDISQDASVESYQRFAESVARLSAPCYWIPGNHDCGALMQELAGRKAMSADTICCGNWQIVMLDSTERGQVYGHLSSAELERLEQALKEAQQPGSPIEHTLVCLHHNPLPGDAEWMRNIGLHNADELIALLSRYSSVRAVVHGHIHQQRDEQAHGQRFICTPSTCIQFKPQASDFELDDQAPGWRWFDLYADGTVVSGVQRLQGFDSTADLNSAGY